MTIHRYKKGDTVFMKADLLKQTRSSEPCTVSATLPVSNGSAHYRVRFDSENFERVVSEDNIDASKSGIAAATKKRSDQKTQWFKPDLIKIRK